MNRKEKAVMLQRYEDRFAQFGRSVKSLGWGNLESQELRFEILAGIGCSNGESVLDVGCGFGDFYGYLERLGVEVDYCGIDMVENFILEARTAYPSGEFLVMDISDKLPDRTFDYVISSGTLNLKCDDNLGYIKTMLSRMFSLAEKGVAINFLSTYVDYELDKDFHFDPGQALDIGKQLTRYVTIRHDYPLYEFTMYLYRDHNRQNG